MDTPYSTRPVFLPAGWYILDQDIGFRRVETPDRSISPNDHDARPSARARSSHTNVVESAAEPEDQEEEQQDESDEEDDDQPDDSEDSNPHDDDDVMTDAPSPPPPHTPHPTVGSLTVPTRATPRSTTTTRRRPRDQRVVYIAQSLLPNDDMAQLLHEPYNPLWLTNHDIDESVLTGFTSPMKLEQMFVEGPALLVGDVFRIVDENGEVWRGREAWVSGSLAFKLLP